MKETMKPFIKYPGGKTKEIPTVKQYMPSYCSRYIEPFIGGGSIYFALNIHPSFINDKSKDMYLLYERIKKQDTKLKKALYDLDEAWKLIEKDDFLKEVQKFPFCSYETFKKYYESSTKRKNNTIKRLEESGKALSQSDKQKMEMTSRKTALYMIVRDIYNNYSFDEMHSASFYFLREYCYSSMFRFSAKGDFNVPYGGMSYNLKYMDTKLDYIFSKGMKDYMSDTTIGNKDFADFLDEIGLNKDDFIFLDPPYDTNFSTYDKNPFDKSEQIRLRDYLKKTPAKWMLIIKKTDFILDLYKEFYIREYDMNYMVSFKNRNDRDAKHLIIMNY